ncbi:MAG: hypothetical protein QNJ55_12085 [Xenococcus sp. MO_188.B8]|nr:hypothetical protein [Xenococcus sp. MO_188.B8]
MTISDFWLAIRKGLIAKVISGKEHIIDVEAHHDTPLMLNLNSQIIEQSGAYVLNKTIINY